MFPLNSIRNSINLCDGWVSNAFHEKNFKNICNIRVSYKAVRHLSCFQLPKSVFNTYSESELRFFLVLKNQI